MPTEELFLTTTLTYGHAIEVMEQNDLTSVQINEMMYGLLAQNLGQSKRVFSYSATFDASKPACVPTFERSFEHVDWIDGESVVQAEENTIEEGFNARFHKIEDDLDGLAADITKCFGCVGDLRAELAVRLTELRTAINTINTDIYNKHRDDTGGGMWSGPYFPTDPPIWTDPGYRPGGGWSGGYPVDPNPPLGGFRPIDGYGPIHGGGTPWTQPVGFEEMVGSLGSFTYSGASVMRTVNDPTRATVAGMPARRLDVQVLNGQPHEVWSTQAGLVLTRAGEGISVDDNATRSWSNDNAAVVGKVSQWAAENRVELAEALGADGVTIAELTEKFGDARLDGGATLRDMLVVLPSGAKIEKADQLIDQLADRAATAVMREGLANETLVANVGFQQNDTATDKLSLVNYKGIPADTRATLIAKGIKTIGDLQSTDPAKIQKTLAGTSGAVSAGEAARWVGEARVLTRLGLKM